MAVVSTLRVPWRVQARNLTIVHPMKTTSMGLVTITSEDVLGPMQIQVDDGISRTTDLLVPVPFEMSSRVVLSPTLDHIRMENARLLVLGLALELQSQVWLDGSRWEFSAKLDAPDLEQTGSTVGEQKAGGWKFQPVGGSAQLQLSGKKEQSSEDWVQGASIDWNVILDKVRIRLQSPEGDLLVRGPLELAVQTRGRWVAGLDLFVEPSRISVDGRELVIKKAPQFDKPQGSELLLTFEASANKSGFKIDPLSLRYASVLSLDGGVAGDSSKNIRLRQVTLRGPGTNVSASGEINSKQEMNLLLDLKQLDFAQAETWATPLKPFQLRGSSSARIHIRGLWDSRKGIQGSPLTASGQMQLQLAKYTYKSPAKSTEGKGATQAPPSAGAQAPPEPLAPNWPIIRNSQIRVSGGVRNFQFNDLLVQDIQWNTQLDRGSLTGSGSLKVFGGTVAFSDLATSLLTPNPVTRLTTQVQGLQMRDAVNWGAPDWKDQMRGVLNGSVRSQFPLPSHPRFLDELTADGRFTVTQGQFSSLKFQNLAKEKLSKVPGVGSGANVNLKDVLMDASAQFRVAKKVLELQDLKMKTPERDELQAQGRLGFDKSVDLTGTAYLVDPPVGGTLREANQDSSGRMVIPIKITGKINDPQASFAAETVQKLLANAAQHELKKLQRGQGNPQLQDLGKKAEEGLRNLFGPRGR